MQSSKQGALAEWSGTGLQNLLQWFDSATHLKKTGTASVPVFFVSEILIPAAVPALPGIRGAAKFWPMKLPGSNAFPIIGHTDRCKADFAKLNAPKFFRPHCRFSTNHFCHCHQQKMSIIPHEASGRNCREGGCSLIYCLPHGSCGRSRRISCCQCETISPRSPHGCPRRIRGSQSVPEA